MITLPASQDAIDLVDWLEASLLTQHAGRISDTAIIDVFSEADLTKTLMRCWPPSIKRCAREAKVSALATLSKGMDWVMHELRPWTSYVPYSFMLFMSLNQSYGELSYAGGTANEPAELFETLASKAVEKYLDCAVIRIGAPRRHPVPSQFPTALDMP